MSLSESRGQLTFLLVVLLIAAPAIATLAWFDAIHWNYVLNQPDQSPTLPEGRGLAPEDLQRLKQSILRVQVATCSGDGWNTGTGFVLATGYVATAAHVVKDHQACQATVRLVDHRGLEHSAQLSAFSDETQLDLAILSFGEVSLQPLDLADSTAYESVSTATEVITIGYPSGVSTEEQAALSGAGHISSFGEDRFFTSGMNLNPGNSGGPVFLEDDWTVLGMAIAKGDPARGGEGVGVVVPSAALRAFFSDRTGQRL